MIKSVPMDPNLRDCMDYQKIHKVNTPLRPICLSICSYNYKLASELSKLLSPFTRNTYSIRNTFEFIKEIHDLPTDWTYLASFDVSSLFTNIPLKETIDIATRFAFEKKNTFNGLSKTQFKKLLTIATSETNFKNRIYDRMD